MKYTLYIKADHNNGDYITSMNVIDEETLTLVKKVCEAIKNTNAKWGHNWITSEHCSKEDKQPIELYKDVLTEDEISEFDELVPYGEYGIHSIVEIKYAPEIDWKKVL